MVLLSRIITHRMGGIEMIITKEYIESHVEKIPEAGCWIWMGGVQSRGYGLTGIPKTRNKILVHRASYESFIGKIPEGMYVCHRCDNPICCNPHHLFLGTQKENLHDMVKKKRHNPHMSNRTHCKHGHEFTEENTRRWGGKRICKECRKRHQ